MDVSILAEGYTDVLAARGSCIDSYFIYTHILESHSRQGCRLFMHYNQVLTSDGLGRLEAFTETFVDRFFPFRKSFSRAPVLRASEIYVCACNKYPEGAA